MRRHAHPLLNLGVLKIQTFSVSFVGASLFRIAISTLPFLLPLMFQLAFGLSPLTSGLLVVAVFAGNLAMKSRTTWVIQRWGFRRVLLVNGAIGVAALAACALFDADMQHWLIMLVLFIGGLSRSLPRRSSAPAPMSRWIGCDTSLPDMNRPTCRRRR